MKKQKYNNLFPEYISQSDTSIIRKDLKKSKFILKIKIFLLILFFILYEATTYIFKNNICILNFNIDKFLYLIISSFILMMSILSNVEINSKKNNLPDHTIGQKIILTLSFFSICSRIVYLILFQNFFTSDTNLFIGIFIIFLIFNCLNKIFVKKRILKNLKFIGSSNTKYVAKTYSKDIIPKDISNFIDTSDPIGIYQVKSEKIVNFVKNSYSCENFKKYINITSIILSTVSLFFSILHFIFFKNLLYSLSLICIFLFISYPISCILALNISIYSSCKKALRKGALITNESTIKNFSKVNTAILDASLLYPSKNVILKEIKTFRGQRVDEAILYAATLSSTKDGTLNKVFDRIILGQKKILEKVSNVIYEENMGISGWVNGLEVVIGNRDILKKYKVDPPSRDYETKYTKKNEGLLYIAVNKELVAMFILEYEPNKSLKNKLFKVLKSGIDIIIRTSDTNITPSRISSDFKIPEGLIKILPYNQEMPTNKSSSISKSSEASLATTGECSSLLYAICLCKKTYQNFRLIYSLQVVSIFIAVLISLILSFNGTIEQINELEILMYIFFWSFVSNICAKLK